MARNEALQIALVSVLGNVPAEKLGILEKLLTEGKGGTMFGCLNFAPVSKEDARDVMTAAIEEVEHDRRIVLHRRDLHGLIAQAQTQIQRAINQAKILGDLGDVEYMDGNADLEAFLADAARSLRAAQALKPTDKDGN